MPNVGPRFFEPPAQVHPVPLITMALVVTPVLRAVHTSSAALFDIFSNPATNDCARCHGFVLRVFRHKPPNTSETARPGTSSRRGCPRLRLSPSASVRTKHSRVGPSPLIGQARETTKVHRTAPLYPEPCVISPVARVQNEFRLSGRGTELHAGAPCTGLSCAPCRRISTAGTRTLSNLRCRSRPAPNVMTGSWSGSLAAIALSFTKGFATALASHGHGLKQIRVYDTFAT